MEYNFERREVYIPQRHLKKDRIVELTKSENIVFNLLWTNKNGSRSYEMITKELYNSDDMTECDKNNIRRIVCRMRKKGIEIYPVNGYGYKIGGNK